jgi:hypothetical protein
MIMATSDVKTNIRLPGELYTQIKELADRDLRSVNAQMIVLLREAVERRQLQRKAPNDTAQP